MIWWQFNQDCGDGTTVAVRFRTEEEAIRAREWAEKQSYWIGDGDGAPVIKIDTESNWFFESLAGFTDGELE